MEIDSGTLADVDSLGRLVGVEVIRPDRDWPLDDILISFHISDQQAQELRAEHRKTSHRGGRGHGAIVLDVITAIGGAAIVVWRVIRSAARVPVR